MLVMISDKFMLAENLPHVGDVYADHEKLYWNGLSQSRILETRIEGVSGNQTWYEHLKIPYDGLIVAIGAIENIISNCMLSSSIWSLIAFQLIEIWG